LLFRRLAKKDCFQQTLSYHLFMKKILIFLVVCLTFFLIASGSASSFQKEVSTTLDKKILTVAVKNSYPTKVKMTIVFSNHKKKSLIAQSAICNRKRPPDCFFSFDLNSLGPNYVKRAVYRINNGKRFRIRVKYQNGLRKYRCQSRDCQVLKGQ